MDSVESGVYSSRTEPAGQALDLLRRFPRITDVAPPRETRKERARKGLIVSPPATDGLGSPRNAPDSRGRTMNPQARRRAGRGVRANAATFRRNGRSFNFAVVPDRARYAGSSSIRGREQTGATHIVPNNPRNIVEGEEKQSKYHRE